VVFEDVALGDATALLQPGRNFLAIHGLNSAATGDDFLIVPRLEGVPASEGVPIASTTTVKARALVDGAWSALNEATFVVDTPLRITEILYHPLSEDGDGFEEAEYEFVELQNVGATPIDLSRTSLEGGIEFDFAESAVKTLPPGGIIVVVKDPRAFALRYPEAVGAVAGQFRGRLDNLGDYLVLRGPAGEALLDFDYDDDWYPETDGTGRSLAIVDATLDPSTWGDPASWKPSAFPLGSPGVDESAGLQGLQIPSDINQDAHLDISDGVSLLGHLFLGAIPVLPCGGGTSEETANRTLLDANGDGGVNLSDAIYVLNYLFLGGTPPALGPGCVRIPGCPDACR
jgi:hypothetical protein